MSRYTIIAHLECPKRVETPVALEKWVIRLSKNVRKRAGQMGWISDRDLGDCLGVKLSISVSSMRKHMRVFNYLKRYKFETIYSFDRQAKEIMYVEA